MGRPTKAQLRERLERERKLMPQVAIEHDEPVNTRRDIEWVYHNMSLLFLRDKGTGLETLNEETLLQAPSNGAIGLASYALNHRKEFFEKFVPKILTKEAEDGSSEDGYDESVDPDFRGLEQYIEKYVTES